MQKKREENGDSYDPICVVANLCYMLLVRHQMTILLLNSKKLECLKESQIYIYWSSVCPLFWGNFRPMSKSKQKCYGTGW